MSTHLSRRPISWQLIVAWTIAAALSIIFSYWTLEAVGIEVAIRTDSLTAVQATVLEKPSWVGSTPNQGGPATSYTHYELKLRLDNNQEVTVPRVNENLYGATTIGQKIEAKLWNGQVIEVAGDLAPHGWENLARLGWSALLYPPLLMSILWLVGRRLSRHRLRALTVRQLLPGLGIGLLIAFLILVPVGALTGFEGGYNSFWPLIGVWVAIAIARKNSRKQAARS